MELLMHYHGVGSSIFGLLPIRRTDFICHILVTNTEKSRTMYFVAQLIMSHATGWNCQQLAKTVKVSF
jgi:hypothetical protein